MFFKSYFIINFLLIAFIRRVLTVESVNKDVDENPNEMPNDYPHYRNGKHGGKMYFAIAAPPSELSFSRAFNKTLFNITQSFITTRTRIATYNITLDTLSIELPENGSFSAILLETLCEKFEGKHVVALLIIGNSPAAFTVSMAATHSGVPVLWARGQGAFHTGFRGMESHALEMHLAPTGREVMHALRGILLQAHWHTFTILADRTSLPTLQRPELWAPLASLPLHPVLVTLPSPLRPQQIFRKLADISRSTRGVIILLSDRQTAINILEDATRLNMLDGHFVWIWVDTSDTPYKNVSRSEDTYSSDRDKFEQQQLQSAKDRERVDRERERDREYEKTRYKRGVHKEMVQNEISDMHINYLLKNDQFLLFNHRNGVESSKIKTRNDILSEKFVKSDKLFELPLGLLSLRPVPIKVDRHLVKGVVRLLVSTLKAVMERGPDWLTESIAMERLTTSCWKPQGVKEFNFSTVFGRELKIARTEALAGKKLIQENSVDKVDKSLVSNFEILNLVPDHTSKEPDNNNNINNSTQNKNDVEGSGLRWKRVGMVSGRSVRLDTIVWPGGDLSVAAISTRARTVFRVVTALAPPFVMESEVDEDGQCLRGLPCHRVLTSDKDNLTLVFNEMEYKQRLEDEEEEQNMDGQHPTHDYVEDEDKFFPFQKFKYRTHCCFGLSMDLLENVAQELEFDFRLYIVSDGLFGSKTTLKQKTNKLKREVGKKFLNYRFSKDDTSLIEERNRDRDHDYNVKWNGVVGDLVSGTAHMSFAPLSVSSSRSEVIDYSVPYFYSGVSFLAAPQQKSEIPLMAFLLPFSPELWIAIFTSLNITAIAVAIYEWLSPFGLNPWGRQRSKNFSMSSALWVMWGLLCGHLVAFKAPKSWPNKFLINVWGGFSVIFVASYTANIAALIAGLFFHNTVSNYHDRSLLSQKVGAPRASASEFYVQKANRLLWEHMHKFSLENVEDGIEALRNGTLDILIADTPILDYYRATDHGCKLQKIGDTINEDTYAIGMTKGFPLKDSISAVIAKYSSNGYMDILQEKWYGGLPCFKLPTELAQPRPLGVAAVTGVFILLGVGMIMGLLILLVEHLFFRYTLPKLREKPKGSVWRSRNIMFFSQKLYRFINCVELVSPHHAARELVHTIRQGQITSLFQKSIKRKEHEQRRRRKSKAQFFEMIQEIRRQQQEEREQPLESVTEVDAENQLSPDDKHKHKLSPSIIRRTFMRTSPKMENTAKVMKSPTLFKPLFSPRSKDKAKSSTNLNVRRFSTDSVFNSQTLKLDRCAVGRRLSKDASCFLSSSPPDINSRRSSNLDIIPAGNMLAGKSPVLSIENVSDLRVHERKLSDSESIGRKLATLPKYRESYDKQLLTPQYSLTLGKSDETLSKSDKPLDDNLVCAAKSYQNICEPNIDVNSSVVNLTPEQKSNLSDDEIARRNKLTIEQLHTQVAAKVLKPALPPRRDNNTKTNPHILIQVEDTSTCAPVTIVPKRSMAAKRERSRLRHQSLGDPTKVPSITPEPAKRNKVPEHSRSLDGPNTSSSKERSRSPRCKEHDLPPAPPPPNCSPRNSNGRSPLERLSKDELVLLWRSSESELRSHLLKAIRDKDVADPP